MIGKEVYFLNGSGFIFGTIIKETPKKVAIHFSFLDILSTRFIEKCKVVDKEEKVMLYRTDNNALSIIHNHPNGLYPFEIDVDKKIGVL